MIIIADAIRCCSCNMHDKMFSFSTWKILLLSFPQEMSSWTNSNIQNTAFCTYRRTSPSNFKGFSPVIFDQCGHVSLCGSNSSELVSTMASRGRCCLDSCLWWCWSGLWSSEERSQPLSGCCQRKTAACWHGSAVFSAGDAAAAVVSGHRLSSPGCLLSPAWSLAAVWGSLDPGETWAAQCCCWFALCVTSPPEAFWAAERKNKVIRQLILELNVSINKDNLLLTIFEMLLDLEFTLWVRVRCSWELVIAAVIVGAMAGSLCCRGLCRENLISAGFIPPIYSPTSPYECVGLGLSGVSHSLSQSESSVTQKGMWSSSTLNCFRDNG